MRYRPRLSTTNVTICFCNSTSTTHCRYYTIHLLYSFLSFFDLFFDCLESPHDASCAGAPYQHHSRHLSVRPSYRRSSVPDNDSMDIDMEQSDTATRASIGTFITHYSDHQYPTETPDVILARKQSAAIRPPDAPQSPPPPLPSESTSNPPVLCRAPSPKSPTISPMRRSMENHPHLSPRPTEQPSAKITIQVRN